MENIKKWIKLLFIVFIIGVILYFVMCDDDNGKVKRQHQRRLKQNYNRNYENFDGTANLSESENSNQDQLNHSRSSTDVSNSESEDPKSLSDNSSESENNNNNNNTDDFLLNPGETRPDMPTQSDLAFAKKNGMVTKNSAFVQGNIAYKPANYVDGVRGGQTTKDYDQLFELNNPLRDPLNNGGFTGYEEVASIDNYSSFATKSNPKLSTKDKMDASKLLPNDGNKWFDQEVPNNVNIDVNNNHLINIYRPIGQNTILTTNKNATHDLRGDIPNPKTQVSVWNQSSIEPDVYMRGLLAGCHKN